VTATPFGSADWYCLNAHERQQMFVLHGLKGELTVIRSITQP